MKKKTPLKLQNTGKKKIFHTLVKSLFWFFIGAFLSSFFLISFAFILFQRNYNNVIYPGITVNGVNFGGKTEKDVENFFAEKNAKIAETKFIFTISDSNLPDGSVAIHTSAKDLDFGYNNGLLAKQAFSIGRSGNILSDISLILQSYLYGVNLPPSYRYSEVKLESLILPVTEKVNFSPTDALFNFQGGKVIAFKMSAQGQEVDVNELKKRLYSKTLTIISSEKTQTINFTIPVKTLKPKITTDKANNIGIKELIGTGASLFQHSIPGRIFNITLASTRLNGILIPPGEVFSFNKALGDISSFTGYQQAYIIQNGRTVLGDGGGVCQVSTTLFRAILDAGLPITERHAHAYRVGYYEQDSSPGIDATIYSPGIDLRFKNDTGNYILIQTFIDPNYQKLTFLLYGTKDGRQVTVSKPVITSQTPPPPPLYQDEPTLPKGVTKQVDFEAWGASVYFTRQVMKDGKTTIDDKFVSNYKPWQSVFLKGTKE